MEELRYAAQDHNHTYDEVDDSAAIRVMQLLARLSLGTLFKKS